jgi:hypothetical protein
LGREILQQRDLLVGERLHIGPARDDPTQECVLLPQRYR